MWVGTVWVADEEAVWLSSFDITKGDVKWVVGFIAVEFRAGVWVGNSTLRR